MLGGCGVGAEDNTRLLTAARVTPAPGAQELVAVKLPYSWPSRDWDGPADERALRIEIDFDARAGEDLALLVEGTTLVFTATLNGLPVHATGDADSPRIPYASWRAGPTFRLPVAAVQAGANHLVLDGFVPAGTRYATLGALRIGAGDTIEQVAFNIWLRFHGGPMLVAAVLVALGLVSLGLWRGRRDNRLFLLLAGGALTWGAHELLRQWPVYLLPTIDTRVLLLSGYTWYGTLVAVFFVRFAEQSSRAFEWAAAVLAAVVAPLAYLAAMTDLGAAMSVTLRGLTLLLVSIGLIGVMRYAWRVREWTGTMLLLMGAACVGFAASDYVAALGGTFPWGRPYLISYAGVALLLFAGWMLLERYHRAYANYELLTRDLEQRVARANVELHRRLDQVEAAHRAAEQANVSKSRFFAAASHDLRQPLHSLGLFAAALRERVSDTDTRLLAQRIGDSIDALDRLFDELLDISRLDAGTVEVRRAAVALQPIFDRLDLAFHEEAARKGLRLRLVPSALVVETDPLLLERVLANLVSNAVRYTPAGGVLVGARRRGESVRLEVWDTGIGIAPEQQALVFDEFYQVGNPARDRRHGLGLGLAIVKRLTSLLGYALSLDSRVGSGTRFALDVPRAHGPAALPVPVGRDDSAAFEHRRVLLVDDEPDICEATAKLLQPWGLEVRTATTFAAAAALIDTGFVPDVILADLRLGADYDGVDLVERLRRRLRARTPALLLSGDTGARELGRVRDSGLLLLTKPVAPAKLRSALHALLSPSRAPV